MSIAPYAVLRAGGKQLKVSPGDVVRIEKPSEAVEKGQELRLSDLILVGGGEGDERTPDGRSVRATVLREIRTRKVLVFKKKKRKQYRRTKGHRQTMLEIRVEGID
jgi:large subunit ribosomal protein L21